MIALIVTGNPSFFIVNAAVVNTPGKDTFQPSAAQNDAGEIIVTYELSSLNDYVSVYAAGVDLLHGVPLGLVSPTVLKPGAGAFMRTMQFQCASNTTGTCVWWGNRTSTVVNPADGSAGAHKQGVTNFGSYATNANSWTTWINQSYRSQWPQ